MTLTSKVIDSLCGQYKNIDIRAIYVRNQSNPQWYCAFLKVYFTNDIKDVIESIHKHKYTLVSVNYDDLRFVSECTDINEAARILKEINDMKVTINGINATLHPYSQNLFESKLDINKHVLESYTTGSPQKDYPNAYQ